MEEESLSSKISPITLFEKEFRYLKVEDVKEFIKELKEDPYSTTKEFWDKFDKISKFAQKFMNRDQLSEFLELIDDICLDTISFNQLDKLAGKELV